MAHYKIYRIGVKAVAEGESLRFIFEDIGFTDEVGANTPVRNPSISEGLGFADEIGAFRELPAIGISEEIGFADEVGETNFRFQVKHFGTLQNSYEDGTLSGTPDLYDYWVTFIPSEYLYWDDDLDTSDLELVIVFRLEDTDLISLPTVDDTIFKSGNSSSGMSISVKRIADNQPYLVVTGALAGVKTYIRVNLKNIDLDTGVWMELFATPTKLVLREYDTPANSFTVTGSWDAGYVDYYESVGASHGSSPVNGTTGGYFKGSVRSIDYYHIGKIDMPADVNLYPFHFYSRFGSDNEGDGGKAAYIGSPTINADWVTFDGNAAYYFSSTVVNEFDITDIDIKITFRLEEDHLDVLDGYYGLWKIGNGTDGFAITIEDRYFSFSSRNDGTLQQNEVSVYNLEMDVWYEAFLSTSKITIREEATPANGFTQSATVDVNAQATTGYHALGAEVGGYIVRGGSGSWADYTQLSVKELVIHRKGGLTFPTDLDAPVYGPVWRWNFGSDVGGIYTFSPTGDPTTNTDHIAFDGNDGMHDTTVHTDPHDRAFVIKFSYTSTFSAVQTLWKTGDEINGIAIGTDSSGNLGVFARSSSTLTSITVDGATDCSTSTIYYIYVTDTAVKVYDSVLSLVAENTGTITIGTLSGSNDNDSVGTSVYGCPIDGSTSTWNSYLTGNVYSVEYWEESEFTFPPSNWYHSEGEIGFADTIGGDVNTAIMEVTSTLGFTEVVGGDLISYVVGISEGIAFTEDVNVLESATFFSEATIGFNESATAKLSTTHGISETLGITEEIGVDHIDESTGEVLSTLGFTEVTDAYNATIRKGSASTLGLNDVVGGHITLKNIGIDATIGFDDVVDGYNSYIYKEVLSNLGLTGVADGTNIITRSEVLSGFGLDDDVDGYNSFNYDSVDAGLGLDDTIDANLTQFEGNDEDIGFSDLVWGHRTTNIVGFSSQLGIEGGVAGGNPLNPDNEGEIGFSEDIDVTHYPVKHVEATIGFDDEINTLRQYSFGTDEEIGFSETIGGENIGDQRPYIPTGLVYNFYVTLTGANDSLDDYPIEKLKTLQLRMKDGESSFVVLSAIYSVEAETQIGLRPNGTLIIEMASYYQGQEVLREELFEVDFQDARYDVGATSQSLVINGYKILTYDFDTVYLEDATSQRTLQDGRVVYRFARPDFYVRPTHIVAYGDQRFTANEVLMYIGERKSYMDVYYDSTESSGQNDYEHYRQWEMDYVKPRKFIAVLTGTPDGKTDYTFDGLVRFECRFNPGIPSYMSATVIYSDSAASAVDERPNGDISIYIVDGIDATPVEYVAVNFNDVSYDLQSTNRTMTLVGYRQFTFVDNTVELTNVTSQRVLDDGQFYVRDVIDPDITIRPGNTLIYNDREFLTGKVIYSFDSGLEVMEVYTFINSTQEIGNEETIGIEGDSRTNYFYKPYAENEVGFTNYSRIVVNGSDIVGIESTLGLLDYIAAELNP